MFFFFFLKNDHKKLVEERVYFLLSLVVEDPGSSVQEPKAELGGKNWCRGPGRSICLLTCYSQLAGSDFLYYLRPPAQGWNWPQWVEPSHINRQSRQSTTGQSDGDIFFNQGSLFWKDSSSCQADMKLEHTVSSPAIYGEGEGINLYTNNPDTEKEREKNSQVKQNINSESWQKWFLKGKLCVITIHNHVFISYSYVFTIISRDSKISNSILEIAVGTGKMAKKEKEPAAKPDDLGFIPRTHMVVGNH